MIWRHMLVQSDIVIHMLEFSKFFGPSPRKHRLTVYRGHQVPNEISHTFYFLLSYVMPRSADFRTMIFSGRNDSQSYPASVCNS